MSRPGSPVLRLEGVTKTYGSGQDRLRVLDGVDLELRRGETTSMIGRSGSGKSPLVPTPVFALLLQADPAPELADAPLG